MQIHSSKCLSKKQYLTLEKFTQTFLPDRQENAIGISADEVGLAVKIDHYLSPMPPYIRLAVKTTLFLFEWMTFLAFYRKRFSKLYYPQRLRYLESWMKSRWMFKKWGYKTIASFCLMNFYSLNQVRERIGYRGHLNDNQII